MNALIVLFSYHHKNTEKISKVIAPIIGAETVAPQLIEPVELSDYGLVGFGSGIYFGKHHRIILEFVDKLSQQNGKKAFIFSTSGQTGNDTKLHKKLREKLIAKGFTIIGEFNCAGFDTYGFLKIAGGIKKGHPNEDDLKAAEAFAKTLNL